MEYLDNVKLMEVLSAHLPEGISSDAVVDDGIFLLNWRSTETFYRHTEDYVSPDKRAMYKAALERTFPMKRGAL